MPQPVFPHHDVCRTGYVDQFGEFGLRVPVSIPPIFEPLHAGCLCPDEIVVDWSVFAVGPDGVEESCISVLTYGDFSAFDGGGEWFLCHGFSYFLSSCVVVSRSPCASSWPFLVSCHRQHGRFLALVPFLSTRWVYPSRSSSTMRLLRLCGVSRQPSIGAIVVRCSWVVGSLSRWRMVITCRWGVLCIRFCFLLGACTWRRLLWRLPIRLTI